MNPVTTNYYRELLEERIRFYERMGKRDDAALLKAKLRDMDRGLPILPAERDRFDPIDHEYQRRYRDDLPSPDEL